MFFSAFSAKNFAALFLVTFLFSFQGIAYGSNTAHFSSGETIEITVQGEESLSNIYYIDKNGLIDMPMIGKVKVAGKTQSEIRRIISESLKSGYIKNPIVTIKGKKLIAPTYSPPAQSSESQNSTHIYIVGEVKTPGYYELPPNASHILNIIALAGGYTKTANKQEYEIVRKIKDKHYRKKTKSGALEYLDGDIIIIKERF